ncbi:MAG TPA: co-chaperone YbbN [Dokdonella sp.]|uniref:thioredoxin family protein n=1 Tax=Dokdonella sp. TaxID=2291710 RepID=UPI0025C2F721|nr:co-chaperone YbbN [Dokdonella sp.]HNV07376.1 co-chaperone YbbN [Dokdonella sp.]HPW03110.1 co-chaperone YbbN [Dokdonella sp.]
MTQPSPTQPTAALDITTANIERELLQASMTQPVLVLFWTPRSNGSIELGKLLESIAGEYQGALTFARINVDSEAQIVGMFGVRSIPTTILMREGQPVDGFGGVLPEAEIRDLLARHLGASVPMDADDVEQPAESPQQAIERLQRELEASPERAELKLDLALALMQSGDARAAQSLLDALPANLEGDDRAKRLRGQLEFAEVLRNAPDIAELERRVAANPNDHEARDLLGVRLLVGGHTEAGLEQFLAILKADRHWNEGLARKRLIAAFLTIDDADLVGTCRRRMSSLLF